jgi:HSP20 family molecular chaperone IbpA
MDERRIRRESRHPGVDPKDVEISVNDDVLSIKGEFEQRER